MPRGNYSAIFNLFFTAEFSHFLSFRKSLENCDVFTKRGGNYSTTSGVPVLYMRQSIRNFQQWSTTGPREAVFFLWNFIENFVPVKKIENLTLWKKNFKTTWFLTKKFRGKLWPMVDLIRAHDRVQRVRQGLARASFVKKEKWSKNISFFSAENP